jgi:hypothetical protein
MIQARDVVLDSYNCSLSAFKAHNTALGRPTELSRREPGQTSEVR